jgi:hypothetical protein
MAQHFPSCALSVSGGIFRTCNVCARCSALCVWRHIQDLQCVCVLQRSVCLAAYSGPVMCVRAAVRKHTTGQEYAAKHRKRIGKKVLSHYV